MSSDAFEFDVALSYAGEDRILVEKVARVLRDANTRLFYDEYFATEVWGEDLYAYLDAVYQTRSKFVAILSLVPTRPNPGQITRDRVLKHGP